MANVEKTGFVDRRTGVRGTRADRGRQGRVRVVEPKVMKVDDWMQSHSWVAYALIFVGFISVVVH